MDSSSVPYIHIYEGGTNHSVIELSTLEPRKHKSTILSQEDNNPQGILLKITLWGNFCKEILQSHFGIVTFQDITNSSYDITYRSLEVFPFFPV